VRPGAGHEFFFKLGFAVGDGLNDVTPFFAWRRSALPWPLSVNIVQPMRTAAYAILVLLLVPGATLSGPSHVHAAPQQVEARGLHDDHVHHGSDHGSDHGANSPDGSSPHEFAPDHEGDDAVTLIWASSEAMPKRLSPCLAAVAFLDELPENLPARSHGRPGFEPRDPPLNSQPPGRAPPA
jgi:hypothetical protein